MTRILAVVAVSIWGALVGTSLASAAEKTIEARAPTTWQPTPLSVAVGDVVTWIMNDQNPNTDGHGVEITNWNDVKGHVEVETVTNQLPFNQMTGQNDDASTTVGQVLLRLKIKSLPSTEIKYQCIVHTTAMQGTARVAPDSRGPIAIFSRLDTKRAMIFQSSSGESFLVGEDPLKPGRLVAIPVDVLGGLKSTAGNTTTVKSFDSPDLHWDKDVEEIELGKEIQWANGSGLHGLRITNWDTVKDAIEVIEAHGTVDNFKKTGETPATTDAVVHARLKINSFPPKTNTIEYECSFHGDLMIGTVKIKDAARPVSDKARRSRSKGVPNE